MTWRRLTTLAVDFDCTPRTLRRRCERLRIAVHDLSHGARADYAIRADDVARLEKGESPQRMPRERTTAPQMLTWNDVKDL